jgi:hypothetical protein
LLQVVVQVDEVELLSPLTEQAEVVVQVVY